MPQAAVLHSLGQLLSVLLRVVFGAVGISVENHSHRLITAAAFIDLAPNSILSVYFPAIF
jgi:hypothetical protein